MMAIRHWAGALALTAGLLIGSAAAQSPQKSPVDQAFALYLAVASGKRSMASLTPEQQKEVRIIAAMMARPRYTSQKCEDLADKQDAARSAADDLRGCLANGGDDCDSQMQDAKDAHDDYEDALDAAEDDCQ